MLDKQDNVVFSKPFLTSTFWNKDLLGYFELEIDYNFKESCRLLCDISLMTIVQTFKGTKEKIVNGQETLLIMLVKGNFALGFGDKNNKYSQHIFGASYVSHTILQK